MNAMRTTPFVILVSLQICFASFVPSLKCDGIQYSLWGIDNVKPAGVCWVEYDEDTNIQSSNILQCTEDGKDLIQHIYDNTDCSGDSTEVSYIEVMEYLGISSGNYSIICSGIPCNYGIKREYPTVSCNDDIDSVTNKYDDEVFVINQCTGMSDWSWQYDSCINGEYAHYEEYFDGNCYASNDTLSFSTTYNNAECDDDGSYIEILCGNATLTTSDDPSSSSNTTVTIGVGGLVLIILLIIVIIIYCKVRGKINQCQKNPVGTAFELINASEQHHNHNTHHGDHHHIPIH